LVTDQYAKAQIYDREDTPKSVLFEGLGINLADIFSDPHKDLPETKGQEVSGVG